MIKISDLWDNIKQFNKYKTRVPEGSRGSNNKKKAFTE